MPVEPGCDFCVRGRTQEGVFLGGPRPARAVEPARNFFVLRGSEQSVLSSSPGVRPGRERGRDMELVATGGDRGALAAKPGRQFRIRNRAELPEFGDSPVTTANAPGVWLGPTVTLLLLRAHSYTKPSPRSPAF